MERSWWLGVEVLVVVRGLADFGLVDWVFCLLLSKWPMVVTSSEGGYFLRVVRVKPGRSGRYFLAMAASRVEMVGDHGAAW